MATVPWPAIVYGSSKAGTTVAPVRWASADAAALASSYVSPTTMTSMLSPPMAAIRVRFCRGVLRGRKTRPWTPRVGARVRQPLAVVAGTGTHHAAGPGLGAEPVDHRVGPAHLVGADDLEVLALDEHLDAEPFREPRTPLQGGPRDHAVQRGGRRLHHPRIDTCSAPHVPIIAHRRLPDRLIPRRDPIARLSRVVSACPDPARLSGATGQLDPAGEDRRWRLRAGRPRRGRARRGSDRPRRLTGRRPRRGRHRGAARRLDQRGERCLRHRRQDRSDGGRRRGGPGARRDLRPARAEAQTAEPGRLPPGRRGHPASGQHPGRPGRAGLPARRARPVRRVPDPAAADRRAATSAGSTRADRRGAPQLPQDRRSRHPGRDRGRRGRTDAGAGVQQGGRGPGQDPAAARRRTRPRPCRSAPISMSPV